MYDNIYTDYSDKQFEYSYPISFDIRNKDYLQTKSNLYGQWAEGDTVEIFFKLTEEDNSEWYENKTVKVTISDFRYEEVYTATFKASPKIVLSIDSKTSQLFTPGVYYCEVKLLDDITNDVTTLLDEEECCLYVK
jgi:hypothetical protein